MEEEIERLKEERSINNEEIRKLRSLGVSAADAIKELQKRNHSIRKKILYYNETPERRKHRLSQDKLRHSKKEAKDPSYRAVENEMYRLRAKSKRRKFIDPFLSDEATFYSLSRTAFPGSIPKLSPEFLRDFGWMESLKK